MTHYAIEVEHFSFSYPQNDGAAARNALQDISFQLSKAPFACLSAQRAAVKPRFSAR